MKSPLKRTAVFAAALAVIAGPSSATWSIVVCDTRNKQVCIAGATCLELFNLKNLIAVVRVEKGAGAAQAAGDVFSQNRPKIRGGLRNERPPWKILDHLEATDNAHQTRQYGIVNMWHTPETFSGTSVNNAFFGVSGQDGDLRYAIQGNLLTGQEVVLAAELAFLTAEGDLTQRVMAAMEAARALGGDGRCSCGAGATSCGVPPPDFEASAWSSFLVLARPGDTDGPGFANGDYYLDIKGNSSDGDEQDAVENLQDAYAEWRAGLVGIPDQLLSKVDVERRVLPADGRSTSAVTVTLADLDGNRIGHGGFPLSVRSRGVLGPSAEVLDLQDHGDGTYSFKLRAGTLPGESVYEVRARVGREEEVLLYPRIHLKLVEPGRPGGE